jgi:hypothetical protein
VRALVKLGQNHVQATSLFDLGRESLMSVPRPAMLVATVIRPGCPARATASSWSWRALSTVRCSRPAPAGKTTGSVCAWICASGCRPQSRHGPGAFSGSDQGF